MSKAGPNWEGLFKWSIAHSDGTRPTRNLSEEDRRWFMEAMQAQSVDVIRRMKEITLVMQTPMQVLESQGVTSADIEGMLDELQEHVEAIDMANDLYSIGGLASLLAYLKNHHANVRAKAADVITTIVQNNPCCQQLVMEANGLEFLLFNFINDPDTTVRTKGLGAISSLIRHNKPGIVAFRLANGYAALKDALTTESERFQRKALNLIHYLLQENSSDSDIIMELGFPRLMMHLAASNDAGVREAAFSGLLELVRDNTDATSSQLSKDDVKLRQLLEERIKAISSMTIDDLAAIREERQLVDLIWNACYNEPSSLQEQGLLILPEEDASPPDIASQHFEPPLRAWAARPEGNRSSSKEEKKVTPVLLLGPGPSQPVPPMEDNTQS
ncbi:hypothetical protein SAY86_021285 [Trapa natans]|uniref:TOG domain-containing protein n=1 Tax=Trapa natans TaxID=22666 RepID=A0AAN7MYU4_TRANT|nr:hypothetical protein SAY86_021285 [Trapa natans]